MPGVADVLKSLSLVLKRAKVRWYLFGAQAVIIHGRVRQSADVDVTVQLGDLAADELVRRLERSGFRLLIAERAAQFIAETRVIPVEHLASHIPVDLVLAGPGLEEEILERARPVEVAGATVPVASPEDLILLKLLAGRPKDLEDVRGIIERQGPRLDTDALTHRVKEVEALLDQSDLTPRLDDLLGAAGRQRSQSTRGKRKRARKRRS